MRSPLRSLRNAPYASDRALTAAEESRSERSSVRQSPTLQSWSSRFERSTDGLVAGSAVTATLDTRRSVVRFPSRPFSPIIARRRCNSFMFSTARRWWLALLSVTLLAAVFASLFYDTQSAWSMAYAAAVEGVLAIAVLFAAFHWCDWRMATLALASFDALYSLGNVTIYCIAVIYIAAWQDTVSRTLIVAEAVAEALCVAVGFSFVLVSDAVPRAILSRRAQQALYGVAAAIFGWVWLRSGILYSAETAAADALGDVCLITCMPLERVLASAAFNLTIFAVKFCVSLWLWPRAACILRARVHVE
jgi:hypothetical protein